MSHRKCWSGDARLHARAGLAPPGSPCGGAREGEGETGGRRHEVGRGGVAGRKEEVSGHNALSDFSLGIVAEIGIELASIDMRRVAFYQKWFALPTQSGILRETAAIAQVWQTDETFSAQKKYPHFSLFSCRR